MIDTKELRNVIREIGLNGICIGEINELLDRLEAAEKERDDLLDELLSVLDWAVTERAPLRNQEIESIRKVIAKATGEQP